MVDICHLEQLHHHNGYSNINTASAITAMLKELAHRVDALHPDVSATDIRVRSCNDIVNAEGER